MTLHEQLVERLRTAGCEFNVSHHEPTRTSEIAAKVRGVPMHAGAKAIVVKGNKTDKHYLFVMPADLKLDGVAVKKILGEPISFAQDVEAVTGCPPGSVPPFGSVIGLPTYVDPRLADNEHIHFNAASLTDSVDMLYKDYIEIEKPTIVAIAK